MAGLVLVANLTRISGGRMFSDFGLCRRFWVHLADDGKLSILFFKFEMAVVIVHVNPT
jgi:hypothetical protein